MKVTLIQFAPILGARAETEGLLQPMLTEAADADLVVLPELCNSGYAFESQEQAWSCGETVQESGFLTFLQGHCRANQQHIVSGFCERSGGQLFNSAVLVGPQGVVGVYRKLHLFGNEKEFFQPGDLGLPVFDLGSVRLGMLVCYDWMVPEAWRALAEQGAQIIAHPSNLVLPGRCQKAIPVHAMQQRIFIATANRIGIEGPYHFTGESLLANPDGEVLIHASAADTELLSADIDPRQADDKQVTPTNHVFQDLRWDQYQLHRDPPPSKGNRS